jgi:acid phosphatase type 7
LIRLTLVLLILLGGALFPLATGPAAVSGNRWPLAQDAGRLREGTMAERRQRGRGQAGAAVLLAAGDIASCDSNGDEATADLLDRFEGTVITLGDHAYESGSRAEFRRCYDPSWGRHKERTRPAPGNHEYKTNRASGYFKYFGSAAGDPDKGYYSYDLGDWHIVALNSNCAEVGGCDERSPQLRWLRADLKASNAVCTLAYWHHPLFTSGTNHGDITEVRPLWEALYKHGAEIELSAHEHNYERFAPQDPTGDADPSRGIRQFIVGTGGASFYEFGSPDANSEVRITGMAGILKLNLRAGGYTWRFVAVGSKARRDRGAGDCH